jgi:tRNA-Thr(GGU) m(6)t(6)A37 methyltransferase TsaA
VENVTYKPIGIIHSSFKEPRGVPIQPSERSEAKGTVEIDEEFVMGLKDLDGFSHLILLFHIHLVKGYDLEVVPFLDDVKRGLFSTRAPRRPNPIGLSVVRLDRIEGRALHVSGLDIVDGTPLLDIKPYVPRFEKAEDVRIGWLTGKSHRAADALADNRFGKR